MKIYRISGKTWRDKKDHIVIYHVSPNRLSSISPMSSFRGRAGAFFSPTYKSIAKDWAPWVSRKKGRTHPLQKQWHDLWDRIFRLEDLKPKTPEQEEELERLEEKAEKMRASFEKVEKERKGYSKVFVHKIACPIDIFKSYKQRMQQQLDESIKNDTVDFGFWAWGEQIFIDEADLPRLKVLKVEEWEKPKMYQEEQDAWLQRYRR